MSLSTLRDRWRLFTGAILTVALGVALVQSSLVVLMSTGEPEIPAGASGREAEHIREGYVGAATLLGMVVPLALFLAVFIVGSTFAFTVAQRRRELALLRMLGGSRPQLVGLLLAEAVLLGLVGSAFGAVLAAPATWAQSSLLVRLGFLPDGFTAVWSFAVLPWSFGFGVAVAVAGVLTAAWRAARTHPLDALRDAPSAARVMTVGRWLVGLSALACAAPLVAAGQSADLLGALLIAMAVSILGAVGLSRLSPLVVPLTGRLVGLVLRTSPLGELAQANLRDGVRRSASTAAPLIVLVALLVGLTGALGSLARATGEDLKRNTAADLVVESSGADAARIAALPGVAVASPQTPLEVSVTAQHREEGRSWRRTHHSGIVAVDPAAYGRTHRPKPRRGSLADLRGRTIAVGPGLAGEGLRVGSAVTARIGDRRVKLRIVALMRETLENNSETFLVPRDLIPPALTADTRTETLVQVAPGTDPRAVADRVRAAGIGEVRTLAAWARGRVDAQQRGNVGILAVLMGMSGLYAAVAVVNAIVIAGAERRAEFAVARVTGLTRSQVVRTALVESAAVAFIGLALGGLVAAAALAGFRDGPGGVRILAVPWGLIGWLVVSTFVITTVANLLTTLAATRPVPVSLVAARE
ncbi:FtsX-like permease family protein [Actinomadura rudentiformis]|uniref:FtsX-like permease family protein n=1 Tax=Actinomadura rudentiformis TaxID=359158 RepID=UPI001CEF96D7|nr:ABC transporter permease [Actinomadura rudentiformis]